MDAVVALWDDATPSEVTELPSTVKGELRSCREDARVVRDIGIEGLINQNMLVVAQNGSNIGR
jgi:hypothetical protein